MKSFIAIAAILSVASASLLPRQLDKIPPCALACALSSLGNTGCPTTDFGCICKAEKFITALTPCVQKSCSAADFELTIEGATGLCASAGVSLSIPAGVVSTSAAGTSAPETSAPAATTTAASSAVSSMATSAQTTAAGTTSAPTTRSGGNGTVSGTSPPQPTGSQPGAASRNTVALGGLGAIVALFAAFL